MAHTARDGDSHRDWARERWVSILRYVLYTVHRDRNREPSFSLFRPGPDPGPVQCV